MSTVTINDVAALAGVSFKTVSRVVNGEPHVRPETREKVQRAIEQLSYTPNVNARALAGSRSYLIGLYFDNPSPDYVAGLQTGAMSGCREAGYHLLVEEIDSRGAEARKQLEVLLRTVRVDGVILSPPVCDNLDVLELLDREKAPYVRIAPATQPDRSAHVYMDDRDAAFQMTRHLQELGHERIGFIKGDETHSAAELRYLGFREAMRAAGLTVEPELVQQGDFSFRSGLECADRLLALPRRPTAVFASNDDMALAAMSVANRLQLTVPDQLSVAGFDDSPIAQVVWPQLTTIRQPVAQMAREAAGMLIRGHGEGQPRGRLLPFELVVRGSTGPATRA